MMELLRRQAKIDKEIHLAVAVDSAKMYLERDGALLREMSVEVAPEKKRGCWAATPCTSRHRAGRGRSSASSGPTDAWEVPLVGLHGSRSHAAGPSDRRSVLWGRLRSSSTGARSLLASYVGPLNDSAYVLPGSIRVGVEDLRAVTPNLQRGTVVYFY